LALALALAVSAAHTTTIVQETPAWPVITEGRYPPEANKGYNFFGQKCYQFLQNATKNRLFLYLYSLRSGIIVGLEVWVRLGLQCQLFKQSLSKRNSNTPIRNTPSSL
jgi:hypothetical protein